MFIEIDLATVPVRTTLNECEDFANLSVRVKLGDHTWIDRDRLVELAGSSATPAWIEKFESMCTYARSRGWIHDSGAIRSHIELIAAEPESDRHVGDDAAHASRTRESHSKDS